MNSVSSFRFFTRATVCLALLASSFCTVADPECATGDGFCNPMRSLILYTVEDRSKTITKYVLVVEQGTPGTLHLYKPDRTTGLLTELSTAALGTSTQKGATNGRFAYFADNGGTISVLSLQNDALALLQNFAPTIPGNPTFARLHPSDRFVYTADSGGEIEIFTVNADGTLASSSTLNTGLGSALDDMTINSAGSFGYVVANAANQLLTYSIQADGSLILVDSSSTGLTSPFDAFLDHDQKYLYVTNSGATSIAVFDASGGVPVFVGSSTTSAFMLQTHLAPNPGNFAYSVSITANTLTASRVNHETGLLTEEFSVGSFSFPAIGTPAPDGKFLYMSENTGNTLRTFAIDPFSSSLNQVDSFAMTMPGDIIFVPETIQEK